MTRLALLLAFLVVACSGVQVGPFPHDPPQPEPPDPWSNNDDPTWDAKASPSVRACAWYARYSCGEAKGTASGMSCVEMVERAEESKTFTFAPECVVKQKAGDCAGASACAHPK